MILQDTRLEDRETFLLLLESSDSSVNINSTYSQLNISIEDTNSTSAVCVLEV